MIMLQLDNIYSGYGKSVVLKDISIKVDKGEVIGLLGANGAGKTTLLKTIVGLLKPYSGKIIFNSVEITKLPPHKIARLGISLVPEGRKILPQLTVEENLLLGTFVGNENFESTLELIYNLFPILRERKKQIGSSLSGGEQQMLAIGRALMTNPKLLLLDEPSLGLSPKLVDEVFKLISKLKDEFSTTILIAEQNTKKTIDISTRLYFLKTGSIVLQGKKEDIEKSDLIKEVYLG
ncbi:MAG: ABC transporter ATP-binding protein [Thermoplasmata archaeon]|jgi:branched-chain amino acid transport system ATP-binding protein|uniref:ABC transporter ATP-binding protein n=1 Tax=Caldisericum sp. TaxID=2499687 RepID=UPI003CC2BA0D